jgi:hypothetical protein
MGWRVDLVHNTMRPNGCVFPSINTCHIGPDLWAPSIRKRVNLTKTSNRCSLSRTSLNSGSNLTFWTYLIVLWHNCLKYDSYLSLSQWTDVHLVWCHQERSLKDVKTTNGRSLPLIFLFILELFYDRDQNYFLDWYRCRATLQFQNHPRMTSLRNKLGTRTQAWTNLQYVKKILCKIKSPQEI